LPAESFYRDYTAALGIGSAAGYARAMAALDEAAADAHNNLFNIGLCYGGYWRLRRGIANYGRFAPAKIEASIGRFTAALYGLKACLPATASPAGRRYLEFLANRISGTLLHLRAFLKMSELQPLFAGKTPPALADTDRRRIGAVCDEAIGLEREYLNPARRYDRGLRLRGNAGQLRRRTAGAGPEDPRGLCRDGRGCRAESLGRASRAQ